MGQCGGAREAHTCGEKSVMDYLGLTVLRIFTMVFLLIFDFVKSASALRKPRMVLKLTDLLA